MRPTKAVLFLSALIGAATTADAARPMSLLASALQIQRRSIWISRHRLKWQTAICELLLTINEALRIDPTLWNVRVRGIGDGLIFVNNRFNLGSAPACPPCAGLGSNASAARTTVARFCSRALSTARLRRGDRRSGELRPQPLSVFQI